MQRKREQSPYSDFIEKVHNDIKNAIVKESPITPSAIRERTGYNWRTVKRHLELLENEGLVSGQRVGRVYIYTLQREGAPQ